MTKECPVIINNDAVTVVSFDGKHVQLPSIHSKAKRVFVKYENGKYTVCDENEPVKKTTEKKKATVNESKDESVTESVDAEVATEEVNDIDDSATVADDVEIPFLFEANAEA